MKKLDFKRDIIEGLKKGERKAQFSFYESYADAMYNICHRMLDSEMDAQDILQSSFMDAFRSIDRYNYLATPGAWLKRIVINNCINHLRKRKLMIVEMNEKYIGSTEVYIETRKANLDVIKKIIKGLSQGYRTILNLYLFEGYDHSEIAEILNISESTSKSQFHRGKQRLKQELIKRQGELYEENEN